MSERQGVEIDYCPDCRGVWLDRGELDKIIEKSMGQNAVTSNQQNIPYENSHPQYRKSEHHDDHDAHGYRQNGSYGYHKKKSWLTELFD
jgi:Zn-finger nucleic acid-binding protein